MGQAGKRSKPASDQDGGAPGARTKELLDRYRLLVRLFDQAPGFMAITSGPEFRIEFANHAYMEHVGFRKVLGLPAREVLPELEEQGILQIIREVYESGVPYVGRDLPVTLRQPDGEVVDLWMTVSYTPIREEDGSIIGIFYEGIDTTEEKRAKEEVRRLNAEIMYMSRLSAMSTMASTLAHELNQPLTAALNYLRVGVWMKNSTPDEAWQAINLSETCIKKASDIIRSLRAVMKKQPLRQAAVPIIDLIQEAAIIGLSGQDGVELETQVPADLLVDVDRLQIEQVLINLMNNAVQAMRQSDQKRLEIAATVEGSEAIVSIADSGPGLPKDVMDKLFERVESTKDTGMGIGLSISRTIIDSAGGRIWAENRDQGGAAFHFSIPLAA